MRWLYKCLTATPLYETAAVLLGCPCTGSGVAPQIFYGKDTELFVVLTQNKGPPERLRNCTALSGLLINTTIPNVRMRDQPFSPDDSVMEESVADVRACAHTLGMQPCLSCCGVLCKGYIVVGNNLKAWCTFCIWCQQHVCISVECGELSRQWYSQRLRIVVHRGLEEKYAIDGKVPIVFAKVLL